ncbi:universal stress protein [Natrialba sp. SSL1]|uniref:universal stress protein n=1 Tax=Natrialba sp. SSL1 TaxID=1869245 RepID=UPI0008F895D2|nr:universal stress protein [Natrialba sp. SSL1]OIB58880.1 universal stress protein UspA [Natrialba sp. SSL1]
MYDSILIPTDGSEQARRAMYHGIGMASAFDATVHALYVIETKAHYIFTSAGHDPGELEEYRDYGERVVTEVVDEAAEEGLSAVGSVRTGSVAQEITEYADEKEIDGIVMATRGRTELGDYITGTTTEKVVRTADMPVTTIRHRG